MRSSSSTRGKRRWWPALAWSVVAMVSTSFADAPPKNSIEVFPPAVHLNRDSTQSQLVVTIRNANGQSRDITHQAHFRVEPPDLGRVSKEGVVTPAGIGDGWIVIEADGMESRASLHVEPRENRPPSFRVNVAALLSKAGCNAGACHGNLSGKGGFRLSLRGEDPTFDFASITREGLGRRVNVARPKSSLIYRKPLGELPHEGGVRFGSQSPEAKALHGWIAAGAKDDVASAPRVVKLDVFPKYRIAAAPSLTQQLVVTAEFADGSSRDVTRAGVLRRQRPDPRPP